MRSHEEVVASRLHRRATLRLLNTCKHVFLSPWQVLLVRGRYSPGVVGEPFLAPVAVHHVGTDSHVAGAAPVAARLVVVAAVVAGDLLERVGEI